MVRPAPRRVRSRVFGRDPAAYDRSRFGYPPRIYEILTERCGLAPGTSVFEIGPGTGIATRELLRRGAGPMLLIEPDRRLARYVTQRLGRRARRVRVAVRPFERLELPTERFDLGVAATSFHWLPEGPALRKVARLLRPGGWWAMWNTYHGDPYRPSPFHRALQPLYHSLSPRSRQRGFGRAMVRRSRWKRMRALASVGAFDRIEAEEVRWSLTLDAGRARALWASFSDIVTLPVGPRLRFLDGLEQVVERRFGGEVTIPVMTPIYTARRAIEA